MVGWKGLAAGLRDVGGGTPLTRGAGGLRLRPHSLFTASQRSGLRALQWMQIDQGSPPAWSCEDRESEGGVTWREPCRWSGRGRRLP